MDEITEYLEFASEGKKSKGQMEENMAKLIIIEAGR